MPDTAPAAAPQGSLLPGRSSVEILRTAPPINLERAFEVMEREGLDGLVVLNPVNVYHLTGLWPVTSRMGFPLNAYAVLSRDPQQPIAIVAAEFAYYYLIADHGFEYPAEFFLFSMATGAATQVFPDLGMAPLSEGERARRAAVQAAVGRQALSADAGSALLRALRSLGLHHGRIAVDSPEIGRIIESAGLAVATVPADHTLQRIRLVKSPRELELMRIAATANAAAALAAAQTARAGASYRELRSSFYAEAARRGNRGVFMVIGGVSAEGVERTLRDGDAFLFDAVSEGAGYHGDFARTVFVGEPAASMRRVSEAITQGWSAVRDALRPGLRFSEITALGRDTLHKAGHDFIVAFSPHSVGLHHTDAPGLGDIVLEPGMVISVDCPVMQTGLGGSAHLEDLSLITATGSEPIHPVSGPVVQV